MRESQDRIKAMALVHEKLYGSEDLAMVDFHGYAESLVSGLFRSYGADMAEITPRVEIHQIPVDVDTAVSCGLIINELVSNALKHAFASKKGGEVLVELCQENSESLVLKVEDDGVGFPAELILMDINLKGPMDGIEASEHIHKRLDIPIVYLTAQSDEGTLKRAKLT